MNNKEKPLTYEEWLKERKTVTNENRARADAYYDTSSQFQKGGWTWIRDAFGELHLIYDALEKNNAFRKRKQEHLDLLLKTMLGLDKSATEKDVEQRAKDFGAFVDILIEKGEQWRAEKKLIELGR